MDSESASYKCFDGLAASLRNDGLSDEADSLHVLLHEVAWATGSELVGELGQALKAIEQGGSPKRSARSRELTEECFKMVFRVWPDFPR